MKEQKCPSHELWLTINDSKNFQEKMAKRKKVMPEIGRDISTMSTT